jgi:hypothetical protein
LKPLINSFRVNLTTRNSSSTINPTNSNASASAGQTASSEAKAAGAADNFDMEIEEDPNYDPNAPLLDYNEEDVDNVPVFDKKTNGKEAVTSEDKEIKN